MLPPLRRVHDAEEGGRVLPADAPGRRRRSTGTLSPLRPALRRAGGLAALLLAGAFGAALAGSLLPLGGDERTRVAAHGPWPPEAPRDPGNRVSGQQAAVALGEQLFHSARLSTVGGLRCSSCHEPWRSFADGRARSTGAELGSRNTISLLDVGQQRWFGWDGANDSLWAQSLRPLLDPREMRSSPARVAGLMRGDAELAALYAAAFGRPPGTDDQVVLVDVAKALAAYQETLVSPRTPFDDFRDALLRGDAAADALDYPAAAQRGLRIFEGRGGCAACHAGARFSDGRFHRSRVVPAAGEPPDGGRRHGVEQWLASPYNRLGRHDDGSAALPQARATRAAGDEPVQDGAFRTPGLRGVASTGPYMHDGSVANLCDTLQPHAVPAGEPGPPAPVLSLDERRDLVAFLRTLGGPDSPLIDPAIYRCAP